jgi:poly(3-hydroxybutyrate) depolymerase
MNASDRWLDRIDVVTVSGATDDPFTPTVVEMQEGLAPLGVRKVWGAIAPRAGHAAFAQPGSVPLGLRVKAGDLVKYFKIPIQVRTATELRRETHRSGVDGSVQEFAVLPPSDGDADAVVLTLHGAGVQCWNQAASYSAKEDFWIVAPTNRRPFGFDWQDWGRRDAYDVLDTFFEQTGGAAREDGSPRPVFLTGHSMGGHGTWHLAANDPATFLAVAPSAGWSSFDSYGGRPEGGLRELWHGADGASRTLDLLVNLIQVPAYVLHGTADDNVPASEATLMLEKLAEAGGSPLHHFQEGAGHWWDGDAAPGADCVDWPPIFDFFRAAPPRDPLAFSFTTADPSVQSRCGFVVVGQPIEYGKLARVDVAFDAGTSRGIVTTSNVRKLRLALEGEAVCDWTIDGQSARAGFPPGLRSIGGGRRGSKAPRGVGGIALLRVGDVWTEGASPASEKTPDQSGPFKRAFDGGFILVPGTLGDYAEDRELLARARFDAAHWWYRANGSAPIVTDVELVRRAQRRDTDPWHDCNVILYGNADTNAAWAHVLDEGCPITARRGWITLGDARFEGHDLGAVFVRPRRKVSRAWDTLPEFSNPIVGVFADSGVAGARLGYTLAPFVSGVGYPDFALFSAQILAAGDGGVLAAGWFDHDWSLQEPRNP